MRSRFFIAGAALGALLAGICLQEAHSALIIFNDGFVVSGKVLQPRQLEVDSGVSISLPSGFIYVDDGARRIIFPPSSTQVAEVLKEDPTEKDIIKIARPASSAKAWPTLPPWKIEKITPWDKNWERTITLNTGVGSKYLPVRQRISMLSTQALQVYTIHEQWMPCFKTQELDPKVVRKLLADYLGRKKELSEPRKRLEIFRFMFQAGWHDLAEKELDQLIADFPDEKNSAEPYRNSLAKVRSAQIIDEIERLHKTGQHEAAQKRLDVFFKNQALVDLAGDKQTMAQELKNKYASAAKKLKEAQKYLKEFPARCVDPGGVLTEAAKEISRDLNIDTLWRLETFLTYAQYYDSKYRELEKQEKRKPKMPADEMLALAVTGWLRGDAAAEQDVALAHKLWQLRQLLLEKPAKNKTILAYCAEQKLTPDLVAQIIPLLPPPDAPRMDNNPQKIDIEAPDALGGQYWVQLPPEYHPNRAYPVLIVLRSGQETEVQAMAHWSELAKQHGYILAAPLWGRGMNFSYQYSAKEHALVLDTIRDLRRRFGVDSDRVFLYGWRAGGAMAYDVGLGHPDQFAGVLPHNASPKYFPERYWPNAQFLPFYVLEGDMNGDGPRENKKLLAEWIRCGYPCMYVEYKGRGSEWFEAELPIMFDWMNRKKRAHPTRGLGRTVSGGTAPGEEFKSMRDCDNRFYWLTTDSIHPNCINSSKEWAKGKRPAEFQAQLTSAASVDFKLDPKNPKLDPKKPIVDKVRTWNQINVKTYGLKQVTIWLGPNMIDFTKPVIIYHKGDQLKQRMVHPSLATLLEDFLHQWDRQRLFLAKIELKG
jgi:predicted esterase